MGSASGRVKNLGSVSNQAGHYAMSDRSSGRCMNRSTKGVLVIFGFPVELGIFDFFDFRFFRFGFGNGGSAARCFTVFSLWGSAATGTALISEISDEKKVDKSFGWILEWTLIFHDLGYLAF